MLATLYDSEIQHIKTWKQTDKKASIFTMYESYLIVKISNVQDGSKNTSTASRRSFEGHLPTTPATCHADSSSSNRLL